MKMNCLWHKLKHCGFMNCAMCHMNCTCRCIYEENRKRFSTEMNFIEIQFMERSENSWRKPISGGIAVNSQMIFPLLKKSSDCKGMIKMSINQKITAYDRVTEARKSQRPMGGYFVDRMIDNFVEFHGDRRFGDDSAIIGGIGFLNGIPVTVIAMERGNTVEERMKRHFGCPTPEGYRKALRLMKEAEKFKRPVICFIGSSGAYCGIDAEERGQGEAIAENLYEMMTLKTPVISVVVGEGGSGGALALGVCDTCVMLENSVYSVISPEGCASILWKDSAKAPEAANALKLTAQDLFKFEIAEKIIDEQDKTSEEICSDLKKFLVAEIKAKQELSVEELLNFRYNKFRKIGAVSEEK